ncbi:MAG: serine hydroxymethyltransferase [Deltaproteobacteria bacterium]|nr:serine hydroxymethyltransferase [Deltaproteobacteria bacterium]MBI3389361.1 serine hydroxymethyltransferase [Deltaproteobacteria bacterium]
MDFHSIDPDAAAILDAEEARQRDTLMMIPSENYASPTVIAAVANVFANKYAEGAPGARYYNGCGPSDAIERLAIDRAKQLFGAEHASVQPHSGAQMNLAVYFALLQPGDTVLALDLNQGGHLTHGSPVNMSGQLYRFIHYGVNRETERLDMDDIAELAERVRPKLIVTGATAYPRLWDFAAWRGLADRVGAYLMADVSHIAGLIVGGVHPDPVPHCDVVTTTTQKTLGGPRSAVILCRKALAAKIDKAVFPGTQGGPHVNTIFAKAIAFREAMSEGFRARQQQTIVNARELAAGLIDAGFRLVSGGTDNHLMLIDLRPQHLTGKVAANLLEEAGIVANKNTIPYDQRPPTICSGLRLGTPALTTRGMGSVEMRQIAQWIGAVLHQPDDASLRMRIAADVRALCVRFPIWPVS